MLIDLKFNGRKNFIILCFLEILVSFKKKKEYKSYKAYFLMSTIIFSVSIIN